MIEDVCAILVEAGLIAAGHRPRFNIEITRGDAVVIYAFVSKHDFVHVKASDATPLYGAYQAQCAARKALPNHVPRPLGFFSLHGWDFAVTQGIDAVAVEGEQLGRAHGILTGDLLAVLTGSKRAVDTARSSVDIESFLRQMHTSFLGTPVAATVELWLTEPGIQELRTLPVLPQHGDFVLNNLGLCANGLIAFDWEDYGKVSLPGFDLCTLIASSLEFRSEKIAQVAVGGSSAQHSWYDLLIVDYCRDIGIDQSMFRRLIPLYLATFLFLKASYGKRVQEVVRAALYGLIDSGAVPFCGNR